MNELGYLSSWLRAPDMTTVLFLLTANLFSPHIAAYTQPDQNPEHRPNTIRDLN